MEINQQRTPLFEALQKHANKTPISFHVPGHKNGEIFSENEEAVFREILSIDQTELSGLDDLHHPEGVIAEAQTLAAKLYKVDHTFFLVNGTTAGNLAMILATCEANRLVLVQRNSHKSIMHGLELAGVQPVFLTPTYEKEYNRYSGISFETVSLALKKYPHIKAIILTYPDYYGHTYDIERIIQLAHTYDIPVLVDEAHGAHFILGEGIPRTAIDFGADVVVQSAHKMLPAMTMGSFLHTQGSRISKQDIAKYLQMVQSSSPSYPIMASLDIARKFLSQLNNKRLHAILDSVNTVREKLNEGIHWKLIPSKKEIDDPLKITLQIYDHTYTKKVAQMFEELGMFPEMVSHNQILLIHGLAPFKKVQQLANTVNFINDRLKISENNDKIEEVTISTGTEKLLYSYQMLKRMKTKWIDWDNAMDCISAETVIPYPPGIPLLLKGERITDYHIVAIEKLLTDKLNYQYQGKNLQSGIKVYTQD